MKQAAAAGGNPEERMKLLGEAEKVLSTSSATCRCSSTASTISYRPKLKGWEDNVMDVHPSRFISKEG